VTAAAVADGVCQFFGGPYDDQTRTYRTPTIPGVGLVRRAWPREDNGADYFLGMPPGTATGCVIVVQITDTHDTRVALPAVAGRRLVRYVVELHCFFLSTARMVEDCQDAVHALHDAVKARIRTDPTLGTGGIENNAFQVGEGAADGGEIAAHIEQGGTVNGETKAYMAISFEAHAYEVG